MALEMRKLRIWLVSVGALLAIYLLYTFLGRTGGIDLAPSGQYAGGLDDGNLGNWADKAGTIDGVNVRTVQKAEYITRDKRTKQVERIFGFEELLHEQRDHWEIRKPYLDIFEPNFKCAITADCGTVRLEDAPGGPAPTDGVLSGNVVIHIIPKDLNTFPDSFVYLDDIAFVADKSRFSTSGPVNFVSKNTEMVGRGLEGVYDGAFSRLDFLRIIHLESLRHRLLRSAVFGGTETHEDASASPPSAGQTAVQNERLGTARSQKPKASPFIHSNAVEEAEGQYYTCAFLKNVLVDAPEQILFADDKILINNVFWPSDSDRKSRADSNAPKDSPDFPPDRNVSGRRATTHLAPADTKTARAFFAGGDEPNQSSTEYIDVIITCDGGILFTPIEANRTYLPAARFGLGASSAADKSPKTPDDIHGARKYALTAQEVNVDLSKAQVPTTDVEHMAAAGGPVQLSAVNKQDRQLLGFTKLQAARLEFVPAQQLFVATGPGSIVVDNSRLSEPNSEPNLPAGIDANSHEGSEPNSEPNAPARLFRLKELCWVVIEDFDTLKYYLETNLVIADARSRQMRIGYVPVLNGKLGRATNVTAGHIEAQLYETPDRQLELSTLTASGGITYEDAHKQFEGDRLFFDAATSVMTISGDQTRPCYFNGTAVDAIEWNLTTGDLTFEIGSPGQINVK